MALSHNILTQTVSGDKRVVYTETTFDSSYPTGGEAIAASDFGLTKIEFVQATSGPAAGGLVTWDRTNSKLLVRDSGANAGDVFPEQANATDLSAFVVHLTVVGA